MKYLKIILICIVLIIGSYFYLDYSQEDVSEDVIVEIDDTFTKEEKTISNLEYYSPLDDLGRVGQVEACLSYEKMPTVERGAIGHIKPTGWHTIRYDDLITDKYLYNRCHLIAYELTGQNDNERNLMTGTRYFNIEGMLPYENEVAYYIRDTHHHVFYQVTPDFHGDELVARGITLRACSIEDDEIEISVYINNIQPGIIINYKNGNSRRA